MSLTFEVDGRAPDPQFARRPRHPPRSLADNLYGSWPTTCGSLRPHDRTYGRFTQWRREGRHVEGLELLRNQTIGGHFGIGHAGRMRDSPPGGQSWDSCVLATAPAVA